MPDVEPREWVKIFNNGKAVAYPLKSPVKRRVEDVHVPKVVVASFPAEDLDDEDENYVLRECEVCKMEFESKRKDARFCSSKCRKKANRETKNA